MHLIKVELEEKLQALKENIYFEQVVDADLRTIAECTGLYGFERGEMLFFEDDPCAGLHILRTGCVKLYRVSPQGRQYIVRLCQENDTFNEVSVFDGNGNPVNAETIEPSTMWIVGSDCLRRMVLGNPDFSQKVINNLTQNLRLLVRAVSEMAFFQVTHRLARMITETSMGEGMASRLTQDQIAARLGTVREVVARSLRELERSGAITIEQRHIQVADGGILSQWAQGPWN